MKDIFIDNVNLLAFGGRRGGTSLEWLMEKISRGNPGCTIFLCELAQLPRGKEAIHELDHIGLYGSRAYQFWNDCCNRNTEEAAEILILYKEGKITYEELFEHIYLPFGRPFDLEEIRKREKKPQKMVRKITVGHADDFVGNRTAEQMAVMSAYRYLMEGMFFDPNDIGKTFTVEVREVYENGKRCLVAIKTEVTK